MLDECHAANGDAPITYFEITTCAALLAFARVPADYTLLEVGLGGRLDATNVVARPALTIITPVSMDHEGFLGDTLAKIAAEKAGIIKRGVPCVVGPQPPEAQDVIERPPPGWGRRCWPMASTGTFPQEARAAGLPGRDRAFWTCRCPACPARTRSRTRAPRWPPCVTSACPSRPSRPR